MGAVPGCNSDADEAPIVPCELFDYSTFAADAPTVSFTADVLPIFADGCAFCDCHARFAAPTQGLYLGPAEQPCDPGDPKRPVDESTRKRIVEQFLTQASRTVTGLARVKPGAPQESLLLHKLDGTHADGCYQGIPTLESLSCRAGDCGERMPRGRDPLPAESRDVLRRWIAQGATVD